MIFVVFLHLDTHSAYRSLMILADYQSIDFHNYELSALLRLVSSSVDFEVNLRILLKV